MTAPASAPLRLSVSLERHPLRAPFTITGYTFTSIGVVVVSLERGGLVGRGEAAGVYYLDDTPQAIFERLEQLRPDIERGINRTALQQLLPVGGARNALDCALWELEARESGIPVWRTAELPGLKPLLTTWTLGADQPEAMAALAHQYSGARALKLKLTGEPIDRERVGAVRAARPDVWIGVDANQGLNPDSYDLLLPALEAADVRLLEQPFPVGRENDLRGLRTVIPIAADESVQGLADLHRHAELFDVFNIKLDKCGGLTEALAMAHAARRLGKQVMVGNMLGTSLSMAPSYVVGQLCDVVDLDGPLLLAADREVHVTYSAGRIHCDDAVWGAPLPTSVGTGP